MASTALLTDPAAFESVLATSKRLLGPGGCPWDHAQTVESLLPHLIEEVWETFEAHRSGSPAAFQEELGDVLYTTLFLALLAERAGSFKLAEMLEATRLKMVRRHPHVFGDGQARTAKQAYASWQRVKRGESARRQASSSKRLRPLLVALWESLHTRQGAAAKALQRTLKLLETSEARGPRRGRPERSTARSRVPARGRKREGREQETS